jgi:hypothetical protein
LGRAGVGCNRAARNHVALPAETTITMIRFNIDSVPKSKFD